MPNLVRYVRPLPTSRKALEDLAMASPGHRVGKIIEVLWSNEKFRSYLSAIDAKSSLEGTMVADDFRAVAMIQAKAQEDEHNSDIAEMGWGIIRRMMNAYLREKELLRRQRRAMALAAYEADQKAAD